MKMSKDKFSKIVKDAFKTKTFEDLLDRQLQYSKGSDLVYGTLQMRSYLKTNEISTNQAELIFKFRSRMINVKDKYKGELS